MRALDSHVHLDFPQFDHDRAELIAELSHEELGVINIATSWESNHQVVELATTNPLIWGAVGLHPTDIDDQTLVNLPARLEELQKICRTNSKIVAIGEVGLDYYRAEDRAKVEIQKAVLRQFLTLATELDRPVIFHCRAAYGDLVTMLADYPKVRGVVHCFTGNSHEAEQFLSLGLLISFTATITYEANESQRQAVSTVPLDKLLLETDCPFLASESRRGQRNDPRTIFEVARVIAQVKQVDATAVLEQTKTNAVNFFKLKS